MKPIASPRRKQLPLYILLLFVVIACMWMLRKCSAAPAQIDRPYAAGSADTIDVAIEYSPLSVYTYADTLGGFNYDLLQLMAADFDRPLRFHPLTSLDRALRGLADSTFDIVVADIPMTLNYSELYHFSEPVYLDKMVLIQTVDSLGTPPVSSQLDLARRQVWVAANTPAVARLRNLSAEIGDTIYIKECEQYGSEQLFLLTAVGEIPLAVVNEQIARAMKPDYPDVDISTAVSFTQFQSWATRASDSIFSARVDSILVDIKQSALYTDLLKRYHINGR